MYALFEETGKFLAGRILSEADTSAQIELDSGKRVKVKSAHILLKFDKPEPAQLIAQAQAVATQDFAAARALWRQAGAWGAPALGRATPLLEPRVPYRRFRVPG